MYPDNDPRSWNYIRKYDRPKLNCIKVTIGTIFTFCLVCLFFLFLHFLLFLSVNTSILYSILLLLGIVLFKLKSILIWTVKLYQRFAPISVRSMCRFEPSCSEYMIQSIEKYGVFLGLRKGIDRLNRCASKDGGFDYP